MGSFVHSLVLIFHPHNRCVFWQFPEGICNSAARLSSRTAAFKSQAIKQMSSVCCTFCPLLPTETVCYKIPSQVLVLTDSSARKQTDIYLLPQAACHIVVHRCILMLNLNSISLDSALCHCTVTWVQRLTSFVSSFLLFVSLWKSFHGWLNHSLRGRACFSVYGIPKRGQKWSFPSTTKYCFSKCI